MPITSNYPDEGFVLPYHKYRDNTEVLERILLVPENSRNFKYATRSVSDDDSLVLVERLIEIVSYLIEINDNSQNWQERRIWLLKLFNELWKKRGAYPGLPEVLSYIGFEEAIDYYKREVENGNDKRAYDSIKDFLDGKSGEISGLNLSGSNLRQIKRNWQLQEDEDREVLINILPRFALSLSGIRKRSIVIHTQ